MFFTNILLSYRNKFMPRKLPKGHIYRGKYRIVKKVSWLDIANVRHDLEREDRNMFYLRNPFLKFEEYDGVCEALHKPHKFFNSMRELRIEKFKENIEDRTVDSYVNRLLKHDNKWE